MFGFLMARADAERRASLLVLVVMRWALIAMAAFQINFRPGTSPGEQSVLNALLLGAVGLNALLQWLLATRRTIALGLPLLVGFCDSLAVTGAIASVEQFDNPNFLLYYPAVLSFAMVFPGKWSITYTAAVMAAYVLACLPGDSFDARSTGDQKALVLRLATMASAALIANLVVRVERRRREVAVAAESERGREVLAMEQRALEAERRAQAERHRLSQEVHDGVSQNMYMLTLGLETAAEAVARQHSDAALGERMQALVRLSREALMETRNLLYDLDRVMTGRASLASLIRNQAAEFTAVSGIQVAVEVRGRERPLDASAVGEIFRVVQEALSNVMRHAGARSTRIELDYEPGALGLKLADDGRGFGTGTLAQGHGLANMKERAARLGGELLVASHDGDGTTIMLRVPYAADASVEDPNPVG